MCIYLRKKKSQKKKKKGKRKREHSYRLCQSMTVDDDSDITGNDKIGKAQKL